MFSCVFDENHVNSMEFRFQDVKNMKKHVPFAKILLFLASGGLEAGGLENLGPPILDLADHMPVLKKKYRGPFNVNVV